MAESEEELKNLLMKVKEKSKNSGLKLNILKSNIMASGPITSWQIDEERMATVKDFLFLGSKNTADGNCSHEIKRHLLLGRKAMTNLDSILKSRDIILLTNVPLVKAMVFPLVMYGYESWTIKKAESLRVDAFELWCWRRLLRDPWTARRSNQSILKEISPDYSLEGLMLKAKAPILWPPDAKSWLIGKDLYAGKDWRQEEKGMTEEEMVGWHHQLDGHEFEQAPRVGDGQGSLVCCSPWGHKESDMTEQLNWSKLNLQMNIIYPSFTSLYLSSASQPFTRSQKISPKSLMCSPLPPPYTEEVERKLRLGGTRNSQSWLRINLFIFLSLWRLIQEATPSPWSLTI